MKGPTAPSDHPVPGQKPVDDADTGLPWLRSWRAVYLFVLGSFLVWVLLLIALTRMYS